MSYQHPVTHIAGPEEEVVTVAEAKMQCRVDSSDEDTLFASLIVAARQVIEHEIGRRIGRQTFELAIADWSSYTTIELPYPPLIEVISITYTDEDGIEHVLSDSTASPLVESDIYVVDTSGFPGAIYLKAGASWPTDVVLGRGYPIRIRYVAGIHDQSVVGGPEVPGALKHAILMMVGHLYENREAVAAGGLTAVPKGVDALCIPFAIREMR